MSQTIIKKLKEVVAANPKGYAQLSKDAQGHFYGTSFETLYREIQCCAAGLQQAGIKRGETVGFIADNRKEWLICDMGLLCLGASDAPRGCDISAKVLTHILSTIGCQTVILENSSQVDKILEVREELPFLKQLIMIDELDENAHAKASEHYKILNYRDLMGKGQLLLEEDPQRIEREIEQGQGTDTATIIFTSGTTGVPKGVVLPHRSYLYQAKIMIESIPLTYSDIWLTILPVWHSFERSIQYLSTLNGTCLAYSKPVGKTLLMDIQAVKPTLMTAVPRLWESLYAGILRNVKAKGSRTEKLFRFFLSHAIRDEHYLCILEDRYPDYTGESMVWAKVTARLGRCLTKPVRALGDKLLFSKIRGKMFASLRTGVSGGGALQGDVDNFFAGIGVKILEGYGLTESGPVVCVRNINHPVMKTLGVAFTGTQVKTLDEEGNETPPGVRGLLFLKGPQVMTGYFKNPEMTASVLDDEGWLNTGDIAVLSRNGDISLVGRAKDTIVLLGGENVEPLPLESKLKESPYIAHAVVLGQDQKYLSALIVPDFDNLEDYAKKNNLIYENRTHLGSVPELRELINKEIADLVCPANGFAGFERIYQFSILRKHFEVGRELSQKMELLRPVVYDMYKDEIESLLKS